MHLTSAWTKDSHGGPSLASEREAVVLGVPDPGQVRVPGNPTDPLQGMHLADTCVVTVGVHGGLHPGLSLAIQVDERSHGKVQLFQRVNNRWRDLGSHGSWSIHLPTIGNSEITLGVIATALRGTKNALGIWDGRFSS